MKLMVGFFWCLKKCGCYGVLLVMYGILFNFVWFVIGLVVFGVEVVVMMFILFLKISFCVMDEVWFEFDWLFLMMNFIGCFVLLIIRLFVN